MGNREVFMKPEVENTTFVTVALENSPGTLDNLLRNLATANIQVLGLSNAGLVGEVDSVTLVVDASNSTMKTLLTKLNLTFVMGVKTMTGIFLVIFSMYLGAPEIESIEKVSNVERVCSKEILRNTWYRIVELKNGKVIAEYDCKPSGYKAVKKEKKK